MIRILYIIIFLQLVNSLYSSGSQEKNTQHILEGNNYFKNSEFEDANNLYIKSGTSKNIKIVSISLYNSGVAFYKLSKNVDDNDEKENLLNKAYYAFKRSLILKGLSKEDSMKTRKNMEIVREELDSLQNQQESNSENQQNQENQNEENNQNKKDNQSNESISDLMNNQQGLNKETAESEKNSEELSNKQKKLADNTKESLQKNSQASKELQKAMEEQQKAAEALKSEDKEKAMEHQKEALKHLREAKEKSEGNNENNQKVEEILQQEMINRERFEKKGGISNVDKDW